MSEQRMRELIDGMLTASGHEAEKARWRLEAAYLPNQVLKPGAAKLVEGLFSGLAVATSDGTLESWEILSQAAAGASGPTAAALDTVREVRDVFFRHAGVPLARLMDPEPQPYDFLAVDVVDALLEFAGPELTEQCVAALSAFGSRGAKEKAHAAMILDAFNS